MKDIAMQIFNRLSLAAAPLLLISCNNSSDENAAANGAGQPVPGSVDAVANDGKLDCALAGAAEFTRICDKEWIVGPKGKIFVARHPDGGFRRFHVLTDGRGLEVAEGAELAKIVTTDNDMIEVSVGDDRYRLPAKIKTTDEPAPAPDEDGIKAADDKVAG